ncbi:MAG: hypothetical protein QOD53_1646 [Thermoleophilaceae bacterium]|nr:hypothetical protein [Thermoleophilaceae bacterium]
MIVPVRNGQATLDACIDSLLALDYPRERLELIVVDNASTDDTPDILRRRDGAVRAVREPTRGAGAARNAGLRAAGGEVIAFTDADCVVDPGWLDHLVTAIGSREDLVAGGVVRAARPANAIELFGERVHDHRGSIELEWPPYVITMSLAAPAGLLHGCPFDEGFLRCEDVDLSYRLFASGAAFAFVPEAVVFHRNEHTLPGLFREGWQHGFHAVRARDKHRPMLRALGHPRTQWHHHAGLARDLVASARGQGPPAPELAFRGGKSLGDLAGRMRRRRSC